MGNIVGRILSMKCRVFCIDRRGKGCLFEGMERSRIAPKELSAAQIDRIEKRRQVNKTIPGVIETPRVSKRRTVLGAVRDFLRLPLW